MIVRAQRHLSLRKFSVRQSPSPLAQRLGAGLGETTITRWYTGDAEPGVSFSFHVIIFAMDYYGIGTSQIQRSRPADIIQPLWKLRLHLGQSGEFSQIKASRNLIYDYNLGLNNGYNAWPWGIEYISGSKTRLRAWISTTNLTVPFRCRVRQNGGTRK
jgi:hypothetical protein